MSAIKTRAKSDGLRLLRAIDSTQAHGQGGSGRTRTGPPTTPGWRWATSAPSVTTKPWVDILFTEITEPEAVGPREC